MKKERSIFWVIMCLLIIGVAAVGYFYKDSWKNFSQTGNEKNSVDVQDQYDTENLPEGVEIVERDGVSQVVNSIDEYELKLNPNTESVSYGAGMLSVQQTENEDELLLSSYDIVFYDNDKNNIEEWIKVWISNMEFSNDYSYKKDKFNDKDFYIINVPSYADSEKILVYEKDKKIVFIDSIFQDPIVIFKNLDIYN